MQRIWTIVVGIVAVHSLVLGMVMLVAPLRALDALGWEFAGTRFFPAQSGLFLIVLGVVYAWAVRRRSLGWVIVLSKALAVLFLLSEAVAGNAPGIVYTTAVADGLMGLAVLLLLSATRPGNSAPPVDPPRSPRG